MVLACLASDLAWAANPSTGESAWLQVEQAQLDSQQRTLSALQHEQATKRGELTEFSVEIERMKQASKGRLLRNGPLEKALQDSQALSVQLTELAQRLASEAQQFEAAKQAAVERMTQRLEMLRSRAEAQTTRESRRDTLNSMRAVRAARDLLRGTLRERPLPNAAVGTLDGTEEIEDVLEKADDVRASQARLQTEMKAVEAQLAERKADAELERKLQRFASEESAFDDQDRRLRFVQRGSEAAPAAARTEGTERSASAGPPPQSAGDSASPPQAPGGSQPAAPSGFGAGGAPPKNNEAAANASGSDARPQIGSGARNAVAFDASEQALEQQRMKLKLLAEELNRREKALRERASQLK